MNRKAAKELIHIQGWLKRVEEGRDAAAACQATTGARSDEQPAGDVHLGELVCRGLQQHHMAPGLTARALLFVAIRSPLGVEVRDARRAGS